MGEKGRVVVRRAAVNSGNKNKDQSWKMGEIPDCCALLAIISMPEVGQYPLNTDRHMCPTHRSATGPCAPCAQPRLLPWTTHDESSRAARFSLNWPGVSRPPCGGGGFSAKIRSASVSFPAINHSIGLRRRGSRSRPPPTNLFLT